jgi:predicted N-acetyltransferase YhbS
MIRIRPMTFADIPLGMQLKQQAGWNQTEKDWSRFLELEPEGCFVAELDGALAGTATTCTFGPVAWVAMVLVDAALRGQGIGKALMGHALDFLDARGVRSVRLDATPLGRPLYEKLGFAAEYQLTRYEGSPLVTEPVNQCVPARPEHLDGLVELDRVVTTTGRDKLLRRLFAEFPGGVRVVEVSGRVEGFVMARPGARAWFIGPCIGSGLAGPCLIVDALGRFAGQPVYLDIPADNPVANRLAADRGLTVQRHLLRMGRGQKVSEDRAALWASSGPEMG